MTDDEKKADRLTTPARDRTMIATRLEPAIHQRVVEAAAASRRSLSAEVEHRITASFDAGWEEASVTTIAQHGLDQSMSAAFEAGLRFGNPEAPIAELLKDGFAFSRGIIYVVQALLGAHPEPRWAYILHLMTETHGLIEELWRAAKKPDFEKDRPLLKLETEDEMGQRYERERATRKSPTDKDPSQ